MAPGEVSCESKTASLVNDFCVELEGYCAASFLRAGEAVLRGEGNGCENLVESCVAVLCSCGEGRVPIVPTRLFGKDTA